MSIKMESQVLKADNVKVVREHVIKKSCHAGVGVGSNIMSQEPNRKWPCSATREWVITSHSLTHAYRIHLPSHFLFVRQDAYSHILDGIHTATMCRGQIAQMKTMYLFYSPP